MRNYRNRRPHGRIHAPAEEEANPFDVGTYAYEVYEDGPTLYYRMGDSDTVLTDSSGNGLDGALTLGAGSRSATGGPVADGGYVTNVTGLAADVAAAINPSNEFTIELWIATPDIAANYTILDFTDEAGNGGGFALTRRNIGGGINFIGVSGATNTLITASGSTPNNGTIWNYVAFSYNSTTGAWSRANGRADLGTISSSGTGTNAGKYAAQSAATGRTICVNTGSNVLTFGGTQFNGSLAEIAVYPTALSVARMTEHFDARNI